MALPSSGPLGFNQVNVELGLSSGATISLNDTPVRNLAEKPSGLISFGDLLGKSGIIRKTISASANNLVMQNLFTTEEWSSSMTKEVIVDAGVTVGSTSPSTAALRTGAIWGGTLTLVNNGSIDGAGGLANSGNGGHALESAGPLIVENNGSIRSGGAGGGKGGKGGKGGAGSSVTFGARDPSSGFRYYVNINGPTPPSYYWWDGDPPYNQAYWAGTTVVLPSKGLTYIDSGGYRYIRGVAQNAAIYSIARQAISTSSTVGGEGGDGGDGGRGRGSNQTPAAGASGDPGAAGGAGAGNGGTGGQGGTGGDWGQNGSKGNTGATGLAGNAGSGLAGVAGLVGGTAGRAVSYVSGGSVTWLVAGTRIGAF